LAALVEPHDLAAARVLPAGLLLARLLELRLCLLPRIVRGGFVLAGNGSLHLRGDVLHRHQHVGDLRRAAQLLRARLREEAVLQAVVAGPRQLGEAAGGAVVVGQDEPVGRHE
jgi:hypothetical protein